MWGAPDKCPGCPCVNPLLHTNGIGTWKNATTPSVNMEGGTARMYNLFQFRWWGRQRAHDEQPILGVSENCARHMYSMMK